VADRFCFVRADERTGRSIRRDQSPQTAEARSEVRFEDVLAVEGVTSCSPEGDATSAGADDDVQPNADACSQPSSIASGKTPARSLQ
jgi:hypothetical protein